jgi:hypothetical protein
MSEFRSYYSRVTVWSRHLPPYYSNLRPLAFFRGSVYECDFFAEVESAKQDSVSGCRGDSMALQGDWGTAIGMSELSRATRRERNAYVAAFGSSTPSILMREVFGFVFRFPRWYERCFPL